MGTLSIFTFYGGFGLLVLRVILGAVLIAHGWPKLKNLKGTGEWMQGIGFKPGILFATLAMLLEFFGGIALIAGFLVQAVAFVAIVQFFILTLWKLKTKQHLVGGYELDLLIFAMAVTLFFLGGGSYSVDRMFLGLV